MKKAIIIPLLLTALMSGCSSTAAHSHSHSHALKVRENQLFEKTLVIKHTKGGEITIKMPALSLEIQALHFLVSHPGKTNPIHLQIAHEMLSISQPVLTRPTHKGFLHVAAKTVLANAIYCDITKSLPAGGGLSDPEAAETQIVAAFNAMSDATLQAARDQARTEISAQMHNGFHAAKDIKFYLGDMIFHGRGSGWQIDKDGTVWFGGGHVSGMTVMVALNSIVKKEASEHKSLNKEFIS